MIDWKNAARSWKEGVLFGLIALIIGAAVGAIAAVFGRGLIAISRLRDANVMRLVPFLAPAGILIVWAYKNYGKESSRGMGLVFAVGHGDEDKIPLRLIPFVLLSTWLTHLCGGSAGREGVAVQIGATLSHWMARHFKPNAGRVFLIAGMAAGFAGLFRTPFAAILFAIEVLYAGKIDYRALFPCFTASFAASTVSSMMGLSKFTADIGAEFDLNALLFGKLLLLGLLFGLTGRLFAALLSYVKKEVATRIKNPYLRVAAVGVMLSVLLLLLHKGRYCGLGTNLIDYSFSGGEIFSYDWLLKLLLTILTLSAGYQGGEVTPLFSIGASLGIELAVLIKVPPKLCAALGYAAVFGSATNTFFAPIMIGAEVFGFENLPLFFIVCTVAHCFGTHNSIYSAQKVLSEN